MSVFSYRLVRLFLFLLFASVTVPGARAMPRVTTLDQLEVRAGESLPDEWIVVAQKARIAGNCGDDLFLLSAKNAELSGQFENDVWVLSETLNLSGTVRDHARLVAKTVEILGSVGNGVTTIGSTVRFGPDARVRGGVRVMAEEAILMGRIEGGAKIRALRVTVAGQITGDLDVESGDLVFLPGARIEGNLLYTAESDLTLAEGVTVTGETVRRAPEGKTVSLQSSGLSVILLYVSALLAGIPFVFFLPRPAGGAVRRLRKNFWICMLTGAVAFPIFSILTVASAASMIGLPLAGVLAASGALAFYLGHIVTALWLGGLVLQRRGMHSFGGVFPALAVGLLIPYALTLVPVAGLLVGFLMAMAGAGALILETAERPAVHPLPPPLAKN